MGNPFLEQSQDLLVLDTRDILDQSVGESVRKAEELGEKQYHNFVDERLVKHEVPIADVILKNKLVLLCHPTTKAPSKQKMQVTALKNDCNLFSRLYISCQTRSGDLETFLMHENQATPPLLSLGGKLRLGNKADLLGCLGLEEMQHGEHTTNKGFHCTAYQTCKLSSKLLVHSPVSGSISSKSNRLGMAER